MPHAYSSRCGHCGCLTAHVQRDLDRRVERLAVGRYEGKPVTSILISRRETLHAFCDKSCWAAAEPALAVKFDLRTTYPPLAFVSSCCRCGASVDRTQPYVCLSISKMTFPPDGSPVGVCSSDRHWAVFCNACEQPGGPETASAAIDLRAPVLEFT